MGNSNDNGPDFSSSGPVEYRPVEATPTGVAELALASQEADLLAIAGVTSVGLCLSTPGRQAIMVGVVDAGVDTQLPREINGVPVLVTVTGPVDARLEP